MNIVLEFYNFLTFACNFNLSAGNLGLFEKNGICFVRSIFEFTKIESLAYFYG